MRLRFVFCVVLVASVAYAREPRAYQTAKLMQMDSVPCAVAEKDRASLADEAIASGSGRKQTQGVFCQEYVLQAESVIYRIRPRDAKHPVLLPVGHQAQFRLEKGKMILRMEVVDHKERKYLVVSMTPRTDSSTADATPARLNHLQ